MINIVKAFLVLIIIGCNDYADIEMHRLNIENVSKEQLFSIKLKKKFHYQAMKIIENSLNDTCMIGLLKVPPGKTGLLYRIEFLSDSISYSYFPYRANSGNLIIEHSFSDD